MSKISVEYKIVNNLGDGDTETSHVKRVVDHVWEGLADVLADPNLEFLTVRRVKDAVDRQLDKLRVTK
jgi:hypothetical protein